MLDAEVEGLAPGELLVHTGTRLLADLGGSLAEADEAGRVSRPAALLCCGLAALAQTAARARGVTDTAPAARAAATLALLTKLDDEVIDSLAFHGGPDTDRGVLRARATAFLAPTLASVQTGSPANTEPRCAFAARLGRDLRALAVDEARHHQLLELIARGWRVQVDAVVTLSAPVGSVSLQEVERVTAEISGAWLAMVTYVGLLGAEVGPQLSETAAFFAWGLHIQAADALADLHKDLRDRFVNTLPVVHAHHLDPERLQRCVLSQDGPGIDAHLIRTGADRAVLPDLARLKRLDGQLSGLGRVPELMRWIHGFLLGRYLDRVGAHPHARTFEPHLSSWTAWQPTHAPEKSCSA